MEIVYAGERSDGYDNSLFLVGPTPRKKEVASWRPEMIAALRAAGHDGKVFVPEPRDGIWKHTYLDQVQWEKEHLDNATMLLAWVARKIPDMMALTTNVEFGLYIESGRMLYGRPPWAERVSYLDWVYKDRGFGQPFTSVEAIAAEAVKRLVKK